VVSDEIGIMRHCGRCLEWLSIDRFQDTEKLCSDCRRGDYHHKRIGPSATRTLSITDKGRAYLEQERTVV
jgi:hypothetical protein